MLPKVKLKTNIDTLNALLLIARHINAACVDNANYTTLVMQHESLAFAAKLIQMNPRSKSITLPFVVCIAMFNFYETVMPFLGTYEQNIYRNIITEMDVVYKNVNIEKKHLFLQ